MVNLPETKKILMTVRTYPTPAKRGIEVSCTAGITEDGKWIRLFPIPYRFMDSDQRFRKYQWIEVEVRKASDSRPESYNPNLDSFKILNRPLPTTNAWLPRKNVVFPLKAHCLCCLKAERDEKGSPTLGLFKPERIERLVLRKTATNWSEAELAKLRQIPMFRSAPLRELEKIPYAFLYQFRCPEADCPGHMLSCTDWEMGESYRRWRSTYGEAWESKFRETYEHDMIEVHDTHFYVGTVNNHPAEWIIVGLFYPPLTAAEQPALL